MSTPPPAVESRLAVDLGGSTIKLGVVAAGRLVETDALANTGVADDLDVALERGAELIGTEPPAGVGIALPGVVDDDRLVAAHDKYGWARGLDLGPAVGRRWPGASVPVVVENDARAALIGETTAGPGACAADVVMIIIGTGIGTAVMLDGRVLRGAGGHRGILGGHLTVTAEPIRCNCGNTGCAEAIGGSWNLSAQARRLDGWPRSSLAPAVRRGRLDLEMLFRARDEHDRVATALSDRVLWSWRTVAVDLCHAYAPELVIFSGGALRAAGRHVDRMSRTIGDSLWSSLPRPRIRRADDPSSSVLLGLAASVGGR